MKPLTIFGLLIVGVIVVTALGVIVANNMDTKSTQTTTTSAQPRIMEIKLGNITTNRQNQKTFAEQSTFKTIDELSLKVVMANVANNSATLSVRLLDSTGHLANLAPSTITVQNGESRFCCWTIQKAGKYSLQVLRPEGGFITLPFTIEPK